MVSKASTNEHLKGAARSGRYPTPLLLVSLVFIIFSLVVDGQPTQEFISIDCGQENNYTDAKTGLSYVSDFDGFVDTGESHKIPINMELYALNRQGYHLRSFPNGTRNCYKISVKKDKKYLIRASFMYANYDQRNESPQFDLQLYDDVMVRVYPQNYSRQYFEEIQAVILRTSLLVCLVNIGSGTPFISSLELRPMNDEMHPTVRSNQSSVLIQRLNIQPNEALILRYPNDVYDRMWMPYFSGSMETLSAESNIIINTNKFQGYPAIPSDVLKTGGVPIANGSNMTITLNWSKDKVGRVEVLFYYAEIQNLTNQSRLFEASSTLWGGRWDGPLGNLNYLDWTVYGNNWDYDKTRVVNGFISQDRQFDLTSANQCLRGLCPQNFDPNVYE